MHAYSVRRGVKSLHHIRVIYGWRLEGGGEMKDMHVCPARLGVKFPFTMTRVARAKTGFHHNK